MSEEVIGRPVRIVSLGFHDREPEEVFGIMEREAGTGVDLVVLPETWSGKTMEKVDGPLVQRCARIARTYRTYVLCPVYREDPAGRRWNSAILFDRDGDSVFTYDKVYPYWDEFDLTPPCECGRSVEVFDADFGRLGIAVCFDVNFPRLWEELAARGAELVVWPSAYSAGSSLMAHALNHHFPIVTSTLVGDCSVFDITGREVLFEASEGVHVSRAVLDLDRCIFHEDFNAPKRDRLLLEQGNDIAMEIRMERERWFVLKASAPGVSARALARRYGLEELRDYLARSRREIDARPSRPG